MDSSHVALISLNLKCDGFEFYRCDRNITIGLNLDSLSKILKCMANNEILTLKAQDDSDVVTFVFETKNGFQVSEFDLKKIHIQHEHLSIPVSLLLFF